MLPFRRVRLLTRDEHATHFARCVDLSENDYECSTSIAKFTPVTTIFFSLNKICDGGSSKEPFLKMAT